MYRQSKRLVTHVTFVRFLSTVNSAATHKATWLSKSFATNSSLHSNGFSPEWLCLCTARWLLVRQHLPQSVHLYSLVWIIICLSIGERRWKAFLALGALKWFFSPECIRSWIFKYRLRAKRLWQTLHQYGLGLSSCRPSVLSVLLASTFISYAWDLSIPSASVSSVLLFPVCSQHTKYISCWSQQNHNQPATS